MKNFVLYLLDFFTGVVKYFPEKLQKNKYIWIFCTLFSTLFIVGYLYFIGV